MLPWDMGQVSTDAWIEHASDLSVPFAVDVRGDGLARMEIGGRFVGFANPDTMDFIRWPAVERLWTEAELIARAHEAADNARTIAKCYFIGGTSGAIKIGFSVDVASRLKAIRSHSPIPVSILAVRDGGEARETAYHRQFAEHRLHGEWFERTPDLEAEIARLNEAEA